MIFSFDCLKPEVLAMPHKRPFLLKRIEHSQVRIVPAVGRTYREFDAMHHDRERGTRFLRLGQQPRNDFNNRGLPGCFLPAECLRRDFDERNQIMLIQLRRQRCKVWETYTKRLNNIAVLRRDS